MEIDSSYIKFQHQTGAIRGNANTPLQKWSTKHSQAPFIWCTLQIAKQKTTDNRKIRNKNKQ